MHVCTFADVRSSSSPYVRVYGLIFLFLLLPSPSRRDWQSNETAAYASKRIKVGEKGGGEEERYVCRAEDDLRPKILMRVGNNCKTVTISFLPASQSSRLCVCIQLQIGWEQATRATRGGDEGLKRAPCSLTHEPECQQRLMFACSSAHPLSLSVCVAAAAAAAAPPAAAAGAPIAATHTT